MLITKTIHRPGAYRLAETDLFLDDGKRYSLRVRDLPLEEKPRERLLANGPSALSAAELLAVILGIGTRKEDVLAMSRRVLKEYGEKAILNERDPKRLASALDIPLVKACQLVAVFEMTRRFSGGTRLGRPEYLRTAKEVWTYLKDMRELPKEHLRGLYLDSRFRLVHDEVLSIGSLNGNLVHPRDVFKPALESNACAVILAHNHPSGDAAPSGSDIEVTRQLVAAGELMGIHLLDHVIVTRDGFESVPADYRS